MEELLALCDRIVVMREGSIACEMDGAGASREALLEAAMGRREAATEALGGP
jgi:ABC-type sugar transport system ATPase subunit